MRGKGEQKVEVEMRAEVRAEAGVMSQDVGSGAETVWWKGVPLTITPPLEQHQLDAGVAEIGQKGIEPKPRVRMRCGAAGFPTWNSVTVRATVVGWNVEQSGMRY